MGEFWGMDFWILLAETDLSQAVPTESGPGLEGLSQPLQMSLFLGGLVLLVGAMASITSFTRIIIVLSFVRRALTTQEIPPNPVIIGLSLFLTLFVMGPTLESINDNVIRPYRDEKINEIEAWNLGSEQLRSFMLHQTRKTDLKLFVELSGIPTPETEAEIPTRVVIPAFMISEIKTAFIMGFCIYIPFILVDLVVSTVLMSLGMMMMPPMVISTPCKLMLFILVDGWRLISQALTQSFV
jgi:flagellar biosynthetic protein FliP